MWMKRCHGVAPSTCRGLVVLGRDRLQVGQVEHRSQPAWDHTPTPITDNRASWSSDSHGTGPTPNRCPMSSLMAPEEIGARM